MWLVTFLRVHWNSEEVFYLFWQSTYPNLKTTCHIKLKFFLWNKLPENLLLAKFLIFVFLFFFGLFFSIRVFFHRRNSKRREWTIFCFTLPFHPLMNIYLQLYWWDSYHVFLIATLVFTRLLLDEIYQLI